MAGKSAAKKLKKIYVFFFQTYIFVRAGRGKIGGNKKLKKYKFYF